MVLIMYILEYNSTYLSSCLLPRYLVAMATLLLEILPIAVPYKRGGEREKERKRKRQKEKRSQTKLIYPKPSARDVSVACIVSALSSNTR